MSPSINVRRAGVVATGTFLLAMAASPAYAGLTPPSLPLPALGSACTSLTSLPTTLKCVNGIVTAVTAPLPTTAPKPSVPAGTTPAPNPGSGLLGGVGGAVGNLGNTVQGAGGTVNGLTGGSVPSGTVPGGATGAAGTVTGKKSGSGAGKGSTSPAAAGAKGSSDGSSLLGPAAAFLPGSGITSFADLSFGDQSLTPLADNIPSPLLASPEQKLAAVQAPLIAAGQRASRQADSVFTRFGGAALPGLLVVIGTALVGAVGAGNLRTWQAKIADKRAKASA